MHVFVTGATGWIGSALSRLLIEEGHRVTGLVRSDEATARLRILGGTPLHGSVADLDVLRRGAEPADAVIHLAFGAASMAQFAQAAREDRQAIEAFGEVLRGSTRPLLVTGGIGTFARGVVYTEKSPLPPIHPTFPRESEQAVRAVRERGVQATSVRMPRSVHGVGERHGFVPRLMALAHAEGFSAYVDAGQNQWPSVHRLDAARVYALALQHGTQDGPYHAVAEQGVPFKAIAEAIGRRLNVPVRSLNPDEAKAHFGVLAIPVAGHGPADSTQTRARLQWQPQQVDLVTDIEQNYAL